MNVNVYVEWRPEGDEDDPECRLYPIHDISIAGVPVIVEAYRVTTTEAPGSIQVGDHPWSEEALDGIALIDAGDGPRQTFTWKNGKEYIVVAYPHC